MSRAGYLARHTASVLLLPFLVTVLVPVWIASRNGLGLRPPAKWHELVGVLVGSAFLGTGLLLFAGSLRRFASDGRGTLAPWDPPRRLVIAGPYRYVRNPMISGVAFVLIGEALVLRSWSHAQWAAIFAALNLVYIPLFEEPQLERRFGRAYREYVRHVPRFLPRIRPWTVDDVPKHNKTSGPDV